MLYYDIINYIIVLSYYLLNMNDIYYGGAGDARVEARVLGEGRIYYMLYHILCYVML